MRLTKLKLSGFKSFVDPTTVLFPGQLVGVVGPNGCGKSNVIDAVRWVLGESKASELRGESIQDVIFKGSGTRKEVSRSSVELHFDNAQGRAAGQWSQYAEIMVKRVLDREGNSNYYINNLHVRRRDVIDLFLGTGLGPRAYAIIGQGMISRIVEAKPEELRFFLEEAAGVTKYKERRKETEHRLEDARENIARVDDIRNELEGQITRLEAQAVVAQQYKDLQVQLHRRQNLLWLKKRNDARREAERAGQDVEKATNRVEAETAQLREVEAKVEQAREAHFAASDALHAAQAEMYSANAEVKRLESEINHVQQSRVRLEARLAQLSVEQNHWSGETQRVEDEEFRWKSLLENSRERAGTAAARHEEAAARLPEAEAAVREAEAAVTEARRQLNEAEQGTRLAEADRGHAVRAMENLGQRRARLEQERAAIEQPDPVQLAQAEEAAARAEEELEVRQSRLAELQGRLPQLEGALRGAREALAAAHRQLAETRARYDALQQLQKRVQQNGEIGDWLKAHGLADAKPLWQVIQVEAGWETAVEAILRERLSALATDAETAGRALASPPPSTFALALPDNASAQPAAADTLRCRVRCDDPRWAAVLDEWLAGVVVADDLSGRVATRSGVAVSKEGHVLSAHGLTLYVPDVRTHGVLERQREIEELETLVASREQEEMAARERQEQAEQALSEAQAQLVEARKSAEEGQQRLHAVQVEALKLSQAQARYEERAGQITRDLEEIVKGEETERAEFERAEAEAARCREQLDAVRERLEAALELQRTRDAALREARALEHQLAREAQEAGFSERECLSKLEDNARAAETAKTQLARVATETEAAQAELAGISDDVLQDQLQTALGSRQGREGLLAERRNALEAAAGELRMLDEQRMKLEQGLQPARDKINDLKLKQQAAVLNEEQYRERLVEGGIATEEDEAALAAELTPALREPVLQGDIARINAEIEALGPVNLAALEELTISRERKGYLDDQS
ncbi:MAG TPA: chromosome segregation protein SMC, partial [Rhodocyclaceae bacterium]